MNDCASAQSLETRGLICGLPVNVQIPNGGKNVRMMTTMLQLPRFRLALEPGQMLRVRACPHTLVCRLELCRPRGLPGLNSSLVVITVHGAAANFFWAGCIFIKQHAPAHCGQ